MKLKFSKCRILWPLTRILKISLSNSHQKQSRRAMKQGIRSTGVKLGLIYSSLTPMMTVLLTQYSKHLSLCNRYIIWQERAQLRSTWGLSQILARAGQEGVQQRTSCHHPRKCFWCSQKGSLLSSQMFTILSPDWEGTTILLPEVQIIQGEMTLCVHSNTKILVRAHFHWVWGAHFQKRKAIVRIKTIKISVQEETRRIKRSRDFLTVKIWLSRPPPKEATLESRLEIRWSSTKTEPRGANSSSTRSPNCHQIPATRTSSIPAHPIPQA